MSPPTSYRIGASQPTVKNASEAQSSKNEPKVETACISAYPTVGFSLAGGRAYKYLPGPDNTVGGFYGEGGLSLRLLPLPLFCKDANVIFTSYPPSNERPWYAFSGLMLDSTFFVDSFEDGTTLSGGRLSLRIGTHGTFLKGGLSFLFNDSLGTNQVGYHFGLSSRIPLALGDARIGPDIELMGGTVDIFRNPKSNENLKISHLSFFNVAAAGAGLLVFGIAAVVDY